MNGTGVVLIDGARTPVGRFQGGLSSIPAHELGGHVVAAALERSGIPGAEVSGAVMGCVAQIGPDTYNARRVARSAGLAWSTPAYNVNRLCGSGLQALWSASADIITGGGPVVVAGGNESMSRIPHYLQVQRERRLGDAILVDGILALLRDPLADMPMGRTAEMVAGRYNVSRASQDAYAAESQRRAATPEARRAFSEEIAPLSSTATSPVLAMDEHPRPATTFESLQLLPPVFEPGGTVTAGNSSGINDGAAALVLSTPEFVAAHGVSALAEIVGFAAFALEPEVMGYAPVGAVRTLLTKHGLSVRDLDVVECNEAFAAQAVAVIRDLDLDEALTNPYGGAIALGHPVGATGTILALRAAYALRRMGGELALVTACIGGGQAIAMLLRNAGD